MKVKVHELHYVIYRINTEDILEALETVRSGNARASTQSFHSLSDRTYVIVTDKNNNESVWLHEWNRKEQKFTWQRK